MFKIISKTKFLNIFLFFIFQNFTPVLSAELQEDIPSSQIKHMPFKLGFEFQEISGLCPWATEDNNVQKQPIFRIIDKDNIPIWRIELDTSDVEFVTVPFSCEQQDLLEKSLKTITFSITQLQNLLDQNRSTSFLSWVDAMKDPLEQEHACNINILREDLIGKIMYLDENSSSWKPVFAPQATIQHPLEWTIPLYFGLLGFDSPTMLSFYGCLPYRDLLQEAITTLNMQNISQIIQSYSRKLNGLVFLHALTLQRMSLTADYVTDKEALETTLENLTKYYQIDPKLYLVLMSRRPFSHMLNDIKHDLILTYAEYFKHSMIQNNKTFTEFFEVPSLFSKTNYGEQYFDEEGKIIPLYHFANLLEEDFLKDNQETILQLFAKGVITTTMIRHFKDMANPLNNYYENALEIEQDTYIRHHLDLTPETEDPIVEENSSQDLLSPPLFLDYKNSMGFLKGEIDPKFGEAVIEVRDIKGIGNWYLRKLGQSENLSGNFLTNFERLFQHGQLLFLSLKGLNSNLVSEINGAIALQFSNYKM